MRNKKSIGLPGGPNEIIVDPKGQWNHPGKNTRIESNQITMQGVEHPVWAQPNVGTGTMMMPGSEHYFKNADYVDEYPMAQDGTEVEEKSFWGLVKEMAKVPGANISNMLGIMGIPANLIAEATESVTGLGDGEFNFMDAMPSLATAASDWDEIFAFTNQNGTPVKNVAGLEDAEGNPLVENPVGAFITNLGTDPSTYVGAGVAKNIIKKGAKTIPAMVKSAYKYNPLAYNNIDSKLPEILQLNKNNEKWLRQVGKPAIVDAQTTRTVREIGETIDPGAFALKLAELKNAPLGQFNMSKRYPGPFFKKGETFFDYSKKPKPGLDGLRNTRGRSGSSDYLIEFDPLDPIKYKGMDSYFQPAYNQVMQLDPKPFSKWVGDVGIMKPKMREVDNFNFYKKDWLRGYKQTPLDELQYGTEIPNEAALPKAQNAGETGNAVVFVESPTRDKYTYDLYDTSKKNLPAELLKFKEDFNFGENMLQGLYGDMSKEKLDNKYLKFLNGLYKDLYNQERQSDIDGGASDQIHAQRMQVYKVIQGEEKKIDQKYKEKIDRYSQMVNLGQESFNNSELNPRTISMDSTFYKEAENLKKVYARLHPNSNVDIVPIYDNPDLVRDKVAGLNPNDSMYFFGHSGDRLGGIPNEEIATILAGSEAENCYLGTCGLQGRELRPFQEALQGKNLQYRPVGSWWGVNPSGSSIEDAMWSRVTDEGKMGLSERGKKATVVKPKLGKDYNKEQDGGQPTQPKTWEDTINYIDQEKLKRAIAQAESLNGKLMKNPDSTASGLYGQRFSELQKGKLYDGTRDEFIADLDAQNRIFGIRLNEGLKSNNTTPLLKDAFDLMNEYKPQIENFNFSYEDIIALSNFLGRQGTREYFGNVIRDGRTLEDVYPTLYGESIKQANKTPTQYLDITRPYYKKQYGNGEERYVVAQDNTRVARPKLNIPPELNFKLNTPLQDFLNTADPTKLNDNYGNDRVVARDNTSISIPRFDKIELPTDQISSDDYEKIVSDIAEDERLQNTPYNSPNLVADFIRKSNEYSSGWKDMSEASDTEIQDLQEVLLSKGYNIGRTGADGVYGRKTYSAHQAMVDDLNLNPTSISRYHKKYSLDTKQEVMGIQQKLVDEGYLSPTLTNRTASSIDGKFGDQTKEALDAYNTANTKEDPQALVFDFIPSSLEETRCAAGMCTILEGNQVMTDALGVKYKDAWDIFENMDKTKNSNTIFNIYDDDAFKNINSVEDLKRITKQVKRKKQTKASDYEVGDIVGLYWDGSSHHEETLNSKTHNTHSGFVSDIVDGVPIITHNVNGSVRQQPYNELTTAWIKRPNENLDIKSKYNVDGIEDIQINDNAIQNLAFKYSGSQEGRVVYEGERLEQLQNIFKRAKYNSLKIPKILNSSVDADWLESTVIGITGVETGVGSSVPRTIDDVTKGSLKNVARGVVYDIEGKEDKDISLGIGKTKLASLDSFAKKYFDINSVEDFKDDNKGLDAITYMITKNYELFKDYAKEYPSLGLTETDIRNMAILAYNQGSSRLLNTGRVADDRTSQQEVQALRELYDATLLDINSTNYKYIPVMADAAFKVGQILPEGLPGSVRPADSYIKKVNKYRSDLFPETFAAIDQNPSTFEMSSMAQGGEYGVYNNYISGKYDGTYREKSATELYNKLNAKHYQEAKQRGMSVPNFIMTELIKDS